MSDAATSNTSDPTSLPRLPARKSESHKGDFGRAVLIGGSLGMSGAITLAGLAALRSGAGLVRLSVPEVCLSAVAAAEPSYMTSPLPCDAEGRIAGRARQPLSEMLRAATAVGCGPGLGRSAELTELVGWLYSHVPQPLVLDADALNALAERPDLTTRSGGPRILTPHPGEFGRLIGRETADALNNRETLATALATKLGAVLVVKGHRTFITDGRQSVHNPTGNPGMATGGTGDVLTGVIVGLLAQGLPTFDAARLGVYIHGLAGDLAAEELGQVSLIASDVVRYLPQAFRKVSS